MLTFLVTGPHLMLRAYKFLLKGVIPLSVIHQRYVDFLWVGFYFFIYLFSHVSYSSLRILFCFGLFFCLFVCLFVFSGSCIILRISSLSSDPRSRSRKCVEQTLICKIKVHFLILLRTFELLFFNT